MILIPGLGFGESVWKDFINHYQKEFTIYALTEIPLYQYVNRAQVVSQNNFTAGVSYRFYIKKKEKCNEE